MLNPRVAVEFGRISGVINIFAN